MKEEESERIEKFVGDVVTRFDDLLSYLCSDAQNAQSDLNQLALHVLGYCLYQDELTS